MMKDSYDIIITGSGPAGLGTAFHIAENSGLSVLLLEKTKISSGGLRNDCKQNYTFPVGFTEDLWEQDEAERLLDHVASHLKPEYIQQRNIEVYIKRAENLGVKLLNIRQAHVGTDRSKILIARLIDELQQKGVTVSLETVLDIVDYDNRRIKLSDGREIAFKKLVLAPGRAGYTWL
jgi:uncharacterized FAD-dependent dehydrogenase